MSADLTTASIRNIQGIKGLMQHSRCRRSYEVMWYLANRFSGEVIALNSRLLPAKRKCRNQICS